MSVAHKKEKKKNKEGWGWSSHCVQRSEPGLSITRPGVSLRAQERIIYLVLRDRRHGRQAVRVAPGSLHNFKLLCSPPKFTKSSPPAAPCTIDPGVSSACYKTGAARLLRSARPPRGINALCFSTSICYAHAPSGFASAVKIRGECGFRFFLSSRSS